ncbi:unnamed protein product [Leptosia nina]|uniref:Uncharacterized protein n=1 Tax=Leptosia nina TaxID=320188 RepID=A0AAV1J9F2_9NEOP
MENSTFGNKTDMEESIMNENYYSLKKQYDILARNFDSLQHELQETKRNFQNALDVEGQLNADFETYQVEEQKRKNELTSRISFLKDEISALQTECSQTAEQNIELVQVLEKENQRLKEEQAFNNKSPEKNSEIIDEIRNKLTLATSESASVKAALDEVKAESSLWQSKVDELLTEMGEIRAAADIRREEIRNATEREATALLELAEAKAMLHQVPSVDLEPHAVKGNSVFAEVEDKRQEMAKNVIQMKQTNTRLRRELANKQAELEALEHEKQTIWVQQVDAATQYGRDLIENYEETIAQLEKLGENQWHEISRGLLKLCEHPRWQPGVLEHLKNEREKLQAEVLAKSAAQLASAVQIRDLRKKVSLQTIDSKSNVS